MQNKNKSLVLIVVFIVVAILFLAAGFLGGFFVEKKSGKPAVILTASQQKTQSALQIINSRLIPSIFATGKVLDVGPTEVIIAQGLDVLDINMDKNTIVTSFVAPPAGQNNSTAAQPKFSISDIKIGDTLSVNLFVTPDGQITAKSILIVPVPKTNAK